jgi:hypothetical protein
MDEDIREKTDEAGFCGEHLQRSMMIRFFVQLISATNGCSFSFWEYAR